MTNHKYHAARFARTAWWHNGKLMQSMLIAAFALTAYLVLPFADNSPPAQGASKAASDIGTTNDYTMDAARDQRLVEEIVANGSIEPRGAGSMQFAQSASKPAVPGGASVDQVADPTSQRTLANENPDQTYSAWLQAAHAHAALHGEDAPLPSQF